MLAAPNFPGGSNLREAGSRKSCSPESVRAVRTACQVCLGSLCIFFVRKKIPNASCFQ